MITLLTLLMALFIGLASCQAQSALPTGTPEGGPESISTAFVSGTITYRERIALTPEMTILVELRDVSLADAAAPLVASQTIRNPGQVPISFRLPYDPDDISPRNTYGISARIEEPDGRLIFINDTAHDVITRGNPSRVDMVLVLAQPPSRFLDEGEPDDDWRTWVEVPVPVISAALMQGEPEHLLRVVYPQSTIEGCARRGNKSIEVDGYDISVRLTLMQPPETPWAIPCSDETVELDEIFHIQSPLDTGKTYRVTVNGWLVNTFTLPGMQLGHTVLAQSDVLSAEISERNDGSYQARIASGRPSGSCTRYNGYEVRQEQPRTIDIIVTHHRVTDPQAICTLDYPVDETLVPLALGLASGEQYTVRINGDTEVSFAAP